jgi:hypothetical protein
MIKRIATAEQFNKAADDISGYLNLKDEDNTYHYLLPNGVESMKQAFAHDKMLVFNVFAWANLNDQGKYDAAIVFLKDKGPRHGLEVFSEYVWLSANPRVGYKLLATAIKYARDNGFERIQMGCSEKSPNKNKVKSLYRRLGFIKDSESYIAKL